MYKWIGFMLLIGVFLISECTNSETYKNKDVAAIVRGEEITVGYLRLLYSDDVIPDIIGGAIKAKLAEQKVKEMKIDITERVQEMQASLREYDVQSESMHEFVDAQAKHFNMEPEEYYKQYTKASTDMVAYIDAYVSVYLGELEDGEDGIEEYNQHANELLDELVEENKDAIEVLIPL